MAVSYSGGKESALALHRVINQGHEPVLLINTYNKDIGRSYSHGIGEELLEQIADSLAIPLLLVKTNSELYAKDFEDALQEAVNMGAEALVTGDIDIDGHRIWINERCKNTGIAPLLPLWGERRENVVYELIDRGFTATITVINTKYLSSDFLGERLTMEVLKSIAASGADICGENGEYHTFVSDGPIFNCPIFFTYGEKRIDGDYAMLPLMERAQ